MTVESELERLILFCEANVYPRTFRRVVVEGLAFFTAQARGPKRLPPEAVRLKWDEFCVRIRGSGILDRLKAESNNWSLVEHFVTGQPIDNVHSLVVTKSPYAKWDVDALFKHLLHEVQQTSTVRGLERFAVMVGLKFLLSEKEKPAHRRDSRWITPTWRFIQPILKRDGFLEPFENEQQLKDRLRHFVRS